VQHGLKGLEKSGTGNAQFLSVQLRKPMQQGLAVQRKFHKHFALVPIRMSALQSALINETIYKFHRTVMAKAELLGECGNSGTSALG
jgi:hypothetical protein